jgi:transposase
VLPEGYSYPKAARAVRDALRQRSPLGRQQTATVLSLHNISVRHTGVRRSAKRIHELTKEERQGMLPEAAQVLAVTSSRAVWACLRPQMPTLEQAVMKCLKPSPAYAQRLPVDGIGTIVAQTIVLETGPISRLPTVGNYASYCRWVTSPKISKGKRTGQGNVKNGDPDLAWAYREAAQFAVRFRPRVQRFYQRKQAKSPLMVARKAVAHTLARACYDMMRDLGPFEVHQALS